MNGSTLCALAFSSLLASRLKNQIQVFVMLYTGFQFFIFAQFLKKSIKEHSNKSFKIILLVLSLSLGIILLSLSFLLGTLYFGTYALI